MLTTEWTAPQPAVTDLYKQVNTVNGSLAMLNQIGGQVLALSEEYPDCEALSRLLATLRTERLGVRRALQATQAAVWHLGLGKMQA